MEGELKTKNDKKIVEFCNWPEVQIKQPFEQRGSQNRGKPVGYRGNRPNRASSVTKTDRQPLPNRTYETELFG
jgi:hypothetical protein